MQNKMPFSPLHLLFFIFLLIVLLVTVQFGLVSIAFERLGLSSQSAFLLLSTSLLGSLINLPLFNIKSSPPSAPTIPVNFGFLRLPPMEFTGVTRIHINVGGGLVPIMFSIYLGLHHTITWWQIISGILIIAIVSYYISKPMHGIGIGMPVFVAPIAAALVATIIAHGNSAPLAYISGSLGVLLGADILRLKNIKAMGLPMASIGGAGTFDGIFLTGIIAVLLAGG